jgi:hypothetical protein
MRLRLRRLTLNRNPKSKIKNQKSYYLIESSTDLVHWATD